MARKIAQCSQAHNGAAYGVNASSVEVDFGRVMQRMRQLRAEISHVDSAARFRDLGIDVYQVSIASALRTRSQRLSHSIRKHLLCTVAAIYTRSTVQCVDMTG